MNALNDVREEFAMPATAALSVTETYWGYILRERAPEAGEWDARGAAFFYLGAVLILLAFGQWLLPGALLGSDLLAAKVALTAVFAGLGGAFWIAARRRAGHVEVQVDTALRELRLVETDGTGRNRLLRRIPMGEIDSIYVKTETGEDPASHLLLQLEEETHPMHIATGERRALRILRDRLKRDLRPAAERVERRLMRQLDASIKENAANARQGA